MSGEFWQMLGVLVFAVPLVGIPVGLYALLGGLTSMYLLGLMKSRDAEGRLQRRRLYLGGGLFTAGLFLFLLILAGGLAWFVDGEGEMIPSLLSVLLHPLLLLGIMGSLPAIVLVGEFRVTRLQQTEGAR